MSSLTYQLTLLVWKWRQLTSPVCDNSCSANLDGLVYALSHPSYWHLYRLSAGVADLDRDFTTRLTGVGGEATSTRARFCAGG